MKTLFSTLSLTMLLLCLLACGGGPQAARAGVSVDGQAVVRLRPPGVGGTNILSHTANDFATNGSGINYQADAANDKVPLIRTDAYPDNRSNSPPAFFDQKVAAIESVGAQPVLVLYLPDTPTSNHPHSNSGSYGLYNNADGTTGGGATIGSSAVYLVQHYLAAPYHLPKVYLQVGNEPNLTIDFAVTPAYYCQLFQAVNDALAAAGLRDSVVLMGPVLAGDYRWSSAGVGPTFLDYFLAHCSQTVDLVDYHSYTGSGDDSGLLNTPHKFDNFYDPARAVAYGVQGGAADDSLTADYGASALLARMALIPFGRPNVGLALTEHNASSQEHLIAQGLWNLGLTHFFLYNPRGQATTSFCFDAYGANEGGLGHYADDKTRDYANWALYVRNNDTGPLVLGQKTTGNLNPSGNPYLLVTATKDDNNLYVEVINRKVTTTTTGDITDTVTLNNVVPAGPATVYRMAAGVTPDVGTQQTLGTSFSYTFPAESATIFKIPITTPPGFVLTAAPVVQMVTPGASAQFPLTVTTQAGYSGSVIYSVTGLPAGATAGFGPDAGGATAAMTVSTPSSTPTGSYPLTVSATDGTQTSSYGITLNVSPPDFLVAGGGARTLGQNNAATVNLTVLALGGWTGPITTAVSGLPSGVTASANPATLDTNGTIVETFAASATAPTGTYPLTITCSGGAITHSVSATLTIVGDFSLAVTPAAQTVTAGTSASYTATITPTPSFARTVSLSASGLPTGATATFTPASVATSGSSTLRVATTAATPNGTYTLTVKASSTLSHTAAVTLTVANTAPPAAPSSLTATAGNGQTQLSWSASTGATSYSLYRGTTSGGEGSTPVRTGLAGTGATDTGLANGQTYYYKVTATGPGGESARSKEASATPLNAPPTVAAAASAVPNPVTGTSAAVSVLGADDMGESNLTYAWSATGPAPVAFTPNGTNAAKGATATFAQAGSYTLTATITDGQGAAVTSSVAVTVGQTLTSIAVSPTSATVTVGQTQPFAATAFDQFGSALSLQPAFTWAASGAGTVSQTGLLAAATTPGSASVTAAAGSVVSPAATATVTVGAASQLVFSRQPANAAVGATLTPPVAVAVTDAYGNAVPGAAISIALTSGAPLGGTLTQTTDATGTAAFPDLSVAASGSYTLTALLNSPSLSATSGAFTINPLTTTTALASSADPSAAGQSVTFTATVTGSGPAGTVTFTDGSTTLGTGTLSGGVATFTATLASGTHSLTASYGGDAVNAAGTSPVLAQTVSPAPASLAVAPAAGTTGQSVTLSATLTSGGSAVPNEAVAFSVDGNAVGTAPTNGSGIAALSYVLPASLSAGPHALAAASAGDALYAPASGSGTLTVDPTALTVAGASGSAGQTLTLSAALKKASGTALGGETLTFRVDGTAVGTATTNSGGTATRAYTVPAALTVGPHALTASFAGDSANAAASGAATLTASVAPTSLSLSNVTGTPGQTVTISATLRRTAGAVAVGGETVAFGVDGSPMGSAVTNAGGVAGLKYVIPAGDAAGAHPVTASFAGDGSFGAGTGTGTLSVGKFGVSLSVAAASGLPGQAVTLSATLKRTTGSAPLAGAVVRFSVDGATAGTATTNASGVASLPYTIVSGAAAGIHSVMTAFSGDASDNAGTGKGALTVKAVTSLAVAAVSGTRGTTVTLSATLTATGGAGVSGRTVTFLIDGKSVGTATTAASGSASRAYVISATATAGSHTITATFAGDGGDGGTSGTAPLTIN